VAKKGKMKAQIGDVKNISPKLLVLLEQYEIFWSNGITP